MTDNNTSDPIVTDDMRACRQFALSLPAGRPFSEFGGGVAHRLHALKADRDHLRKVLRVLDRITAGDEEPTGNEPEDVCQIVERFVELKREAARWKRECLEAIEGTDATSVGGLVATLKGDLEEIRRERDALRRAVRSFDQSPAEIGQHWDAMIGQTDELRGIIRDGLDVDWAAHPENAARLKELDIELADEG